MNVRIISVVILSIALLLSIGSIAYIASISQDVWNSMPTYEWAIIAFNFLVVLATVLVAYWVYDDYEKLEWTYGRSDSLSRENKRLGEIVDDNFDIVFKRLEKIEETLKKEEKQKNL
jgi:hypothetical protein